MIRTIRTVLDKSRETMAYSFLAVFIAAAFLMNFASLPAFVQGKILVSDSISSLDIAFLLIFSFLSALAITMHLYRRAMKQSNAAKDSIGLFGGFLGMFTSACTVCYPFILSFLGIPTALAILPFGGAEIKALSIALLGGSVYFIAQGIKNCAKCNT